MKTRLLLSLFALLTAMTAWADVEINETNFPDKYFRNYLLSQNYGTDGVLTDEEIAGVNTINVRPGYISSLTGIEYFTALTELYCSYNQLTALDVSKNTALTELYCDNNKLTALDVSKNTALTILRCDNNQLTALDVSKNTKLAWLSCENNKLTALDVSQNTALIYLWGGHNQLTALDVSKNTKLYSFRCYSNQLTALDVSKNTVLSELSCYGNQLITLDVSQNTALEWLDCSNNDLTALDVSKNTKLTELDFSHNELTAVDVSKNTKLERLYCHSNQLTALDMAKNTKLTKLHCYQNQIKDETMDALVESLPTINIGDMYVIVNYGEQNVMTTEQVAAAKSKGWIPYEWDGHYWVQYTGSFSGVEITEENFPDENFRNWVYNLASYINNKRLTKEEIAKITTITVTGMNIKTLKGIEFFTALNNLYCGENQLTTLDLSKNTKLTTLHCGQNQLTALDVSKNANLRMLYCNQNQLTTIDVSKNTNLKALFCYQNQLTTLDLSQNKALTQLYCYQNQIKDEGMDALVDSLPMVSKGTLNVIFNENEENMMTYVQVDAAKAKGWIPKYHNAEDNKWYEYEGDPDGIKDIDHSPLTIDHYYNLAGQRIASGNGQLKPGIYVVGGKKVLVRSAK